MRLTTINIEKFQHDGLVVDKGWTQFHYAKADPKAQQSFRDHVGRFVQIHPDDIGQLAKLGLALEGGRIIKAQGDGETDSKSPAPNQTSAPTSAPAQADSKSPAPTQGSGNGKGKDAK